MGKWIMHKLNNDLMCPVLCSLRYYLNHIRAAKHTSINQTDYKDVINVQANKEGHIRAIRQVDNIIMLCMLSDHIFGMK